MNSFDEWYEKKSLCDFCEHFCADTAYEPSGYIYPDEECGYINDALYEMLGKFEKGEPLKPCQKRILRIDYENEFERKLPADESKVEWVGAYYGRTGSGVKTLMCKHFKTDYLKYMNSPEWHERKKRALRKAGYQCEICHSAKNLNVHHITYDHLGYEYDEDLLVVCKFCHARLHSADIKKKQTADDKPVR